MGGGKEDGRRRKRGWEEEEEGGRGWEEEVKRMGEEEGGRGGREGQEEEEGVHKWYELWREAIAYSFLRLWRLKTSSSRRTEIAYGGTRVLRAVRCGHREWC
eukprot:2802535-Rhodomonas_salina.1